MLRHKFSHPQTSHIGRGVTLRHAALPGPNANIQGAMRQFMGASSKLCAIIIRGKRDRNYYNILGC